MHSMSIEPTGRRGPRYPWVEFVKVVFEFVVGPSYSCMWSVNVVDDVSLSLLTYGHRHPVGSVVCDIVLCQIVF